MADQSSEQMLAMQGFMALRQQIIGIAQAAGSIPEEAYDAVIDFSEQQRARAQLAPGVGRAQLDGADLDIRALKAVRTFWKELRAIDEARAARAAIAGTPPGGADGSEGGMAHG